MLEIRVKRCPHYDSKIPLPSYESVGAAGADVRACWDKTEHGEELVIMPGKRFAVPTGLMFSIPKGFEIQVRPRSGISLNTDLLVVNSPGTIDSDYRGEVKIILGNFGDKPHTVKIGERLAQLVLAPVQQANFRFFEELDATERGELGFGSTGIH